MATAIGRVSAAAAPARQDPPVVYVEEPRQVSPESDMNYLPAIFGALAMMAGGSSYGRSRMHILSGPVGQRLGRGQEVRRAKGVRRGR
jgi:hypothetical protein